MKTAMQYLVVCGLIALTACGSKDGGGSSPAPQNSTMDADGNCTQQTISAHNEIWNKAEMFDTTKDQSHLEGAQKACNEFNALIGSSSCRAKNVKTGAEMTLSKETNAPLCSEVNALLNPPSKTKPAPAPSSPKPSPQPAPPPPESPAKNDPPATKPAEPDVELAKVKDGLRITVKDALVMNELLSGTSTLQGGKSVPKSKVKSVQASCKLDKTEASVDLREGDVLVLKNDPNLRAKMDAEPRLLAMRTADKKIKLACMLPAGQKAWKLSQLKEVFGSLVDLKVIGAPAPTPAPANGNGGTRPRGRQ
jgi:hypothetical protein